MNAERYPRQMHPLKPIKIEQKWSPRRPWNEDMQKAMEGENWKKMLNIESDIWLDVGTQLRDV